MGISRPRQFLQSMLCSTDSADPLPEFSEFNIPLKQSFHILTISEPPFAPPTNHNHNMFCDIHIFSATTTTAEALHFSIQELIIVECSAHVQANFALFFCAKKILCDFFMRKKLLRVFSLYNVCNNFFRSSVSATKTSMKVLSIETKQCCTFQSNRNQTELFSDRQSTTECMCVFGRSRKAEMLSRTR